MIGIIIRGRNIEEGGGYTLTYDLLEEIIKFDNKQFFFILVNDQDNFIEKKLKKKNFLYKKITINQNLLYFLNLFKNVIKIDFFKKFLPLDFDDILFKNNINIVWFVSSEFYYPLKTKYILTVWDLMHITHKNFPETGSFFINFYRNIVINNSCKHADKIIVGSKYLKKIIKLNFFNGKKINFIFAKHPTPKLFLSTPKTKKKIIKKPFFLYPANFWEHKNHKNLLLSFHKFNYKKEYYLVLTGNHFKNKYYFNIINFIKDNKIKNIIILGFVSRERLINLYDECLGLIYPSFSGPENIPPLEAFARLKPVAISNYEGAKEQLKNNAFYFNPYSINSILDGFKYLLKNSSKKENNQKLRKFAELNTSNKYLKTILKKIKQ